MNKKPIFVLSLISTIGFLSLISRDVLYFVCKTHNDSCINTVNYTTLFFMIGTATLIPSIIVFFIKEEIFKSWKKITRIFIILSLLIILIIPWYLGDGFLHIQKDLIVLFLAILYLIASFVLIIYKSSKKTPK